MSKLVNVFVTTQLKAQLLQGANLVKNRKKETEFYLFSNNFHHDRENGFLISFVKTPGKFVSYGFKKVFIFKTDEICFELSFFNVEVNRVFQGY